MPRRTLADVINLGLTRRVREFDVAIHVTRKVQAAAELFSTCPSPEVGVVGVERLRDLPGVR